MVKFVNSTSTSYLVFLKFKQINLPRQNDNNLRLFLFLDLF